MFIALPTLVKLEQSTGLNKGISESSAPEIVVTARRDPPVANGEVQPVRSVDEAAIRTYGASSIGDLISAMAPDIRSRRGTEQPILLINGRSIANPELGG